MNKIITIMGLVLVLIGVYSAMDLHSAFADTINKLITPTDDSYLDEDAANENFGKQSLLVAGWTSSDNSTGKNSVKQAVSYLRFDISQIPKSDLLNTVTIDSVQMKLLSQTTWGKSEKFLVTVFYCSDNAWSENKITWNNRVCKNENTLKGSDSTLVLYENLPNVYSWDVTRDIMQARDNNLSSVTFVITAFPLAGRTLPPDNFISSSADLVWFWSKDKGEKLGVSAAPTLTTVYTVNPSVLVNSTLFILTTIVPSLAIIIPAMLWVYRKKKT